MPKITPLEESFNSLVIIESLIDELNQKRRVEVTASQRLTKALEKSAKLLRGNIVSSYKCAFKNMEFTRPNASKHALSKRKWRAKQREELFEKIENYFAL